jgi:hypothetical protein
MVLTMSPNNVSGPNNANEKTHGSPNNAVPAYAHTHTHTHTHTPARPNAFFSFFALQKERLLLLLSQISFYCTSML